MDGFLAIFLFVGGFFIIIYGVVIPIGEMQKDIKQIKEHFIPKEKSEALWPNSKRLLISIGIARFIVLIPISILNANSIRDFMKEKCSAQEAIAALNKGHCVYRAGESKRYCVKKKY